MFKNITLLFWKENDEEKNFTKKYFEYSKRILELSHVDPRVNVVRYIVSYYILMAAVIDHDECKYNVSKLENDNAAVNWSINGKIFFIILFLKDSINYMTILI